MAKIHYNQGHLEVIKIYEKLLQENIASSKQLASSQCKCFRRRISWRSSFLKLLQTFKH